MRHMVKSLPMNRLQRQIVYVVYSDTTDPLARPFRATVTIRQSHLHERYTIPIAFSYNEVGTRLCDYHYRKVDNLGRLSRNSETKKPQLTQRQIAASVHSSRNTISEVLHLTEANGLNWPLDDTVTNEEIMALLYPGRPGAVNRSLITATFIGNWQNLGVKSYIAVD